MTILSAQSILARNIISPCVTKTVYNGKTYGLGAAGYDVRIDFSTVDYNARVMRSPPTEDETFWRKGPSLIGPPKDPESAFFLAATMERFTMPDDIMGIVHDKSSWARKGVTVQNTVIEPGWRGYLTLEITYHGPVGFQEVIVHGDPIAQIVFHKLDQPTIHPYDGKYQDQKQGPQEAIAEC